MLGKLRLEIDLIDQKLFEILGQRLVLSQSIGQHKKTQKISAFQPERKKIVFENWLKLNETLQGKLGVSLSNEGLTQLFEIIQSESLKKQ